MSRAEFEAALGHQFANSAILDQALTHSSYASEHPGVGFNERFEFLGDAVLQLAVTEYLFATYPGLPEGQMAKIRAGTVSGRELAEVARKLHLGSQLRLGKGEEASGGAEKDSILADAMEAVIAAVHLDAGFAVARNIILALWTDLLNAKASAPGGRDFKTRLQELIAGTGRTLEYRVEGSGPDHARQFSAVVLVDGEQIGDGEGRSKKEAQQAAAQRALQKLES